MLTWWLTPNDRRARCCLTPLVKPWVMQFYTTYKFCAKGDTLFLKSCHIVSYCCNSVHKLYKKTLVNIFTLIQEAASCNVQCAGFNCITLHSMQDVMENKCKICSCYMFCPAWASLQKNMGNTK
jgi:hypothetical protein